jgi:anti-sigma B factor antagonist
MTIAPASKGLQFELVEAPAGGVAIVRLVGTLDVSSQQTAERFLADLVTAGHTRLALDCAELSFVSSAGLRALIGTVKLVKPRSGGLAICAPQPPIRQLVELSGLKSLLCLSDTVAAGRVALGG